jgi:hypothetical protein
LAKEEENSTPPKHDAKEMIAFHLSAKAVRKDNNDEEN